jgi:hypothetical protein
MPSGTIKFSISSFEFMFTGEVVGTSTSKFDNDVCNALASAALDLGLDPETSVRFCRVGIKGGLGETRRPEKRTRPTKGQKPYRWIPLAIA